MSRPSPSRLADPDPSVEQGLLQALLDRIAHRDAQALCEFHAITLGRVHGLLLRLLRRPEDAEEVTGDVFLQVWERCADYRPERGSVLAWLNTVAWSRGVDRLRRQRQRTREVALHPEAGDEAYTWREDEDDAHALDALRSAGAIRQAFRALSPAQRRVLELAYFEELSQQEIAARTGLALGTVKSHARRGLAALRAAMNTEGQAHGRE